MAKKSEKNKNTHRIHLFLISVITACLIGLVGWAFFYINSLHRGLENQLVQEVMSATVQQQQAFDRFIASDRERIHSYAEYLSANSNPQIAQDILQLLKEIDAEYTVIYLDADHSWAYSNRYDGEHKLTQTQIEEYNALTGSDVRNHFLGVFQGNEKFGYYEAFTFRDTGNKAVFQKGYNLNEIQETFSLTFYDNQGYTFVVDKHGDILMRPTISSEVWGSNIFDTLLAQEEDSEHLDHLRQDIQNGKRGSIFFQSTRTGMNAIALTYIPMDSVDDWFMVSVVPVEALQNVTGAILHESRIAMVFLGIVLIICIAFVCLIWNMRNNIVAKNREVSYQTQLFHIFSTYLSLNTNDLYMMLDHQTQTLEYVSPNVEQVLGVTKEEVFDYLRTSDMKMDPEGARAHYAKINALMPGETSNPRIVSRINPRTGQERFFLENTYCVDIQGNPKRMIYISDRTTERKSQEFLKDALQMARAGSEAKTAFLSSISHDIRTPMNAIIGFLTLMRDEVENPVTLREYIDHIDVASHQLLGLINDVLDMNKIESGITTLSLEEIDVAEMIHEINSIIRPQADAKQQTFDIFAPHLTHEYLEGDKVRINQILINLLSNAVKYTPVGGRIQLRMEELSNAGGDYSRIRFTVSDNGIGMSEKYQEIIFEPFSREENNMIVHEIQGTGLGMPITKSLVDLMGGTIHLESKQGEGSTFTVELYLHIQEHEENSEKFWSNHKVSRMLVVDDNEDICWNIVKLMSKKKVIMEYATSGSVALQMMYFAKQAGRPYDLVLLDWKMPDLDGLETARLIRKEYSENMPILILTAYDWSTIEKEAIEAGIRYFMPKPFFMSAFKETIRRIRDSQAKTGSGDGGGDVIKGKHILVADDIEVNRMILVKILTTLGARCDTVGNGQEAVQAFEQSRPGDYHLIIMDIQMPVMDGYAATQAIRGGTHPSAKEIPIIAMTANAFVDDVREALNSGMDAHIAKPVQVDILKSTIRQVLDSREEAKRMEGKEH